MQRYKGCHFTDEMGKYLYECVKKNDGFGTHWCYDETLEVFCPDQLARARPKAGSRRTGRPTEGWSRRSSVRMSESDGVNRGWLERGGARGGQTPHEPLASVQLRLAQR